ncbi:MAG: hypothetical protein ACP6IT_04055 [Candidatus Thorarchaeota archaeon]
MSWILDMNSLYENTSARRRSLSQVLSAVVSVMAAISLSIGEAMMSLTHGGPWSLFVIPISVLVATMMYFLMASAGWLREVVAKDLSQSHGVTASGADKFLEFCEAERRLMLVGGWVSALVTRFVWDCLSLALGDVVSGASIEIVLVFSVILTVVVFIVLVSRGDRILRRRFAGVDVIIAEISSSVTARETW